MKRLMSFCAVAVGLVASASVLPGCSSPKTGGNTDSGMQTDSGMTMSTDGGQADAGDGGATDAGSGPAGQTTDLLNSVADAMRSFHKDTGGWPLGGSVWYGTTPAWDSNYFPQPEDPTGFTNNDTALFAQAMDPQSMMKLAACNGEPTQPCWKGPYLTMPAGAMAMSDVKDAWGNSLFFAYMMPPPSPDSSEAAPNGIILIWSTGANGVDETGCTGGACSIDFDALGQGMSSAAGSDDIINVVAMDATKTN